MSVPIIGNALIWGGIAIALVIGVNFLLKVYFIIWQYAGLASVFRLFITTIVYAIYCVAVSVIIEKATIEWAIINAGALLIGMCAIRYLIKMFYSVKTYNKIKKASENQKRVMIIGAGSAGSMLIHEMNVSIKTQRYPACVIDDDKNKIGRYVNGVKVVGDTTEIGYYAEKLNVDEIIIAMPSVEKTVIKRIVEECNKTKKAVKILPGIYQFTIGQVQVSDIKPVSITDLLGREQVKVNLDEIMGYIEGKIVLVTGGGGSIGSELCRQIANHNPKHLIILDIYENNAYDIQQELVRKLPNLKLTTLIASVRDRKKIENVFEKYRPEIVFHAAAHKHVPLMETSPNEAVKNNVGGTFNVADTAGKYGVERFILISTDKAVNPTNVMGATKRICEMIIQTMDKKYKTEYVAVRFGNVLGSNGSVIPLFKRQIEEGGPITVTHKDIVRYFMTIPEAVSLVLQAGAYAKGGEIFVLDMGEPVKIYDLAINMIKLSGLEPFIDIDVKVTGLRPGEKLYEERLMDEEGLNKTQNEKISIGKPLEIDSEILYKKIEELLIEAKGETEKMKELVHDLVPTYKIDSRA
ncbi:MAG: polysaccharide biosynthesis protein [Clostridiales bacterium]|nr:polysaccharide biosynthesis protein [Clostridiales bacterium]